MAEITVIKSEKLSNRYDERFIVVEAETGEILDDANGYGYKSVRNARAAWSYKTRDKSKDAEREAKRKKIRAWMREHRDFVSAIDRYAFEMAKGSWGPDDEINTKFIKQMLKEWNLKPDFTAGDLLKVWRKG